MNISNDMYLLNPSLPSDQEAAKGWSQIFGSQSQSTSQNEAPLYPNLSGLSSASDPPVPLYQPTDLGGPLQAINNAQSYGLDALQRMIHPDGVGGFLHGVIEGAGAVLPDIYTDIGAGLQLGAQWMNNEVNGIPVLSNVLQPIGDLVNGIGGALVDISGGVAQSANDLGSAVDNFAHGDFEGAAGSLFDAGKDAVSGAVNAVKNTIGSAISAIGDLF